MAQITTGTLFFLLLFSWNICLTLSGFVDHSRFVRRKQTKKKLSQYERSVEVIGCSRKNSKLAHNVLDEYFMHFIERESYNLSRDCKLHLLNNMFRKQEASKIENHPSNWKCGICKKHFKSEEYLDQHLDNRHLDQVSKDDGCLGELCPLIHCEHFHKKIDHKIGKCKEAEVNKRKRLCEALAEKCFPASEGVKAIHLHAIFLKQFCDAHTCKRPRELFPLGKRPLLGLYYAFAGLLVLVMALSYGCFYVEYRTSLPKSSILRQPVRLQKRGWSLFKKVKQL